MATKEKPQAMAMLSIAYNKYLMPLEQAVLLFQALTTVECVEESWNGSKMEIRRKDAPEVVMKLVTQQQVAEMVLAE